MNLSAPKIDIRPDHWEIVRGILQKHVPEHEVWAFGSRAKWTAKEYSDLDLAVISDQPLSLDASASLSDEFSESDLPYKVDVVDWATTGESFRKIIERDKVVLQIAGRGWGMASSWPVVRVEDVCSLIVDCVNKTAPVVVQPTPFRMIRTPNVRNGRIDLSDCKFVNEETFKVWTRRADVRAGDVILTREAPIGEVGFVPEQEGLFLGQRLMQYRADQSKLDQRFLLYSFLSPHLQHQFRSHEGSGSVVSHIRVGDCFKFELPLPPLDIQRKIGHVLGALDDKIDVNRRINQTLEAMAQAIFKSWFVDFDPVKAKIAAKAEGRDPLRAAMTAISGKPDAELDKLPPDQFAPLAATAALFPDEMEDSELGEIPKGWTVCPLPECLDINPARVLKKGAIAPYLDMANVPTHAARVDNVVPRAFGSGSKFINGDTLLARITPCLENGKTAYVDFLADGEVGWGSTEFIVLRPKDGLPLPFAYFLCRHPEFRAFAISQMAGTSGRQRVPNDCFGAYKVVKPSALVADAFGQQTTQFMKQIKSLDEASKTLISLRDALLPKLLSGELQVHHTEEEVAA